jgi:hypothetical protein
LEGKYDKQIPILAHFNRRLFTGATGDHPMAGLVITLALLITLAIGIAVGKLAAEDQHTRAENAALKAENDALKAAQARHLPYKTATNLEEGTAVLNYLIIDKETEIAWHQGEIKKLDGDISMTRRGLEFILKARNGKAK